MGLLKILTTSLTALHLITNPAAAAASSHDVQPRADTPSSSYWLANIERQGQAVFSNDTSYKVFRNVKDFGAKGDGVTDDSAAINSAVSALYQGSGSGGRCGSGCGSDTTKPALVYFPPGTYAVSQPIIQTYYTQFVGDAVSVPTIKATANFDGQAVIDANPYFDGGVNWWVNQNNFYREVRNFIIDMTAAQTTTDLHGIHWQVAQATSLQNIVFNMNTDTTPNNKQIGVYIENGSGGFFTDLTFNGGRIGANMGSQQFATRNLTFNNCNTAVSMIWDWIWLMQGVQITGGQVGINLTSGAPNIGSGSFILLDSKISNVPVGIVTAYQPNQNVTNGTLILDNVDMSGNVPVAIQHYEEGKALLPGNAVINGFVQGRQYLSNAGRIVQGAQQGIDIAKDLLAANGNVFTRTKPQYEDVAVGNFKSVKSGGAKGDGQTDDTAAIQKIIDNAGKDDIIYFDHGAYLITDTIKVPSSIKITGEVWPVIMATGEKFMNESSPKPVFQIGQAGDSGDVEISELIMSTKGPVPGAILMEWNVAGSSPGSAGMWDVHFRVGGAAGTDLEVNTCSNQTTTVNPKCMGSFLMLHLTKSASAYIENSWYWVADHELDISPWNQELNIYNGRGVLIESQKPVWMWGTASEHSVLYNYQVSNAKNVFLGMAQTETAYMQGKGHTDAEQGVDIFPMKPWMDPNFNQTCEGANELSCARTWGLRVTDSSDVYVFGAGMYSFFDGYDQACTNTQSCQDSMISIENSAVSMFGVSTKAAVNMIVTDGQPAVLDKDNRNTFCAGIAQYDSKKSGLSSNSSSSYSLAPGTSSTMSTLPSGTPHSMSGLSSYPSPPATTSGLPTPPGGYGQSGGGTSSEAASTLTLFPPSPSGSSAAPSGTTSSAAPTSQGSSDGSGGNGASSAVPPGATSTAATTSQGGSGGSGGNGASSAAVVTVTETVTAPGTCASP